MSEAIKMEYQCEEALDIIANIMRKYYRAETIYPAKEAVESIKNVLRFVKEENK